MQIQITGIVTHYGRITVIRWEIGLITRGTKYMCIGGKASTVQKIIFKPSIISCFFVFFLAFGVHGEVIRREREGGREDETEKKRRRRRRMSVGGEGVWWRKYIARYEGHELARSGPRPRCDLIIPQTDDDRV